MTSSKHLAHFFKSGDLVWVEYPQGKSKKAHITYFSDDGVLFGDPLCGYFVDNEDDGFQLVSTPPEDERCKRCVKSGMSTWDESGTFFTPAGEERYDKKLKDLTEGKIPDDPKPDPKPTGGGCGLFAMAALLAVVVLVLGVGII